MIGGAALASRAIGDVARRDLASEWGGPAPAPSGDALPVARQPTRRVTPRKP
jgi:hypothetical protein